MDRNRLGPFVLLEKLGEGGMGEVYKARDTRLERFVAIKLLPESRVADPDRRARFIQEARAASALNHPNIISVYDIAEDSGRHYMVMEFVNGKALREIIPRKGMRSTDALRIAAQIADALAAAHVAGIVHRDLKPANIMVDLHDRVKVLDFGVAKLLAPAASIATSEADRREAETRTVAMEGPQTEEGMIIGSVPYMSPEQAEGRPVDVRSDIFSFGAVLYEMVTGRRAFQGESRASTLAAIVESNPQAPGEIVPDLPPELERIISRCLRKDVARRSQHMADVKLALEELRDESESGKLAGRPVSGGVPSAGRRWLWPAVAAASAVIALGAIGWTVLRHQTAAPTPVQLFRATADDGYSYTRPTISPDGKFIAAISDRSGTAQLWLQQVGGGDPIQVTHSANAVQRASFFPDGTRLLVWTRSIDGRSTLEIVPTLGGFSRVIYTGESLEGPALSPDGRQVAFFDRDNGQLRLSLISTEGGVPHSVEKWALTQGQLGATGCRWMPDARTLAVIGTTRPNAHNLDDWDLFALPVDGGDPVAMGVGEVLRSNHLEISEGVVFGNRLIISAGRDKRFNVWQLSFTPGSWRVTGPPRQLTFGTENEEPVSVSMNGTVAIQTLREFSDLYLLPLDPASGQPSAPVRRLTRDSRQKSIIYVGGAPGSLYFDVFEWGGRGPIADGFGLDLATSQQTRLIPRADLLVSWTVSPDGRQVAYTRADGDFYSISIADAGSPPETARPLCTRCGFAGRFSPDGRYLLVTPEFRTRSSRKQKFSTSLIEISSARILPWLSDPNESVGVRGFLNNEWALIDVYGRGSDKPARYYVAHWQLDSIPRSEWVQFEPPAASWKYSPSAPFVYAFAKSGLVATRFDPKQRRFGEPFAVRMPAGTGFEPRSGELWSLRGPGLTFSRQESKGSVWLMKLPQ